MRIVGLLRDVAGGGWLAHEREDRLSALLASYHENGILTDMHVWHWEPL